MANDKVWRLLLDRGASGEWNMAVDEALIEAGRGVGPDEGGHTLRVYWFDPPALSLGAFQPLTDVDLAACRLAGVAVVRRPSGGRAVLHEADLTYTVSGPAAGVVFYGGIRASYARIAAALLAALGDLGLGEVEAAAPAGAAPVSPWCFASVAPYEAVASGVKLIGSAQARRGAAALQHGSLRLNRGALSVQSLLRPRTRRPAGPAPADLPVLAELLGRQLCREQAATALARAFATVFNVDMRPGALTPPELALAQRLLERRRTDAALTDQRRNTSGEPRREA